MSRSTNHEINCLNSKFQKLAAQKFMRSKFHEVYRTKNSRGQIFMRSRINEVKDL